MTASDLSPRQQRLAAASLTAAATARASSEARRNRPPAVGDRCLLPATAAFPVEWVLIDQCSAPPAFLAVLADIHPLLGSTDLAAAQGSLRLRCRARIWLDPGALTTATIAGALDQITVERVRRRIQELDREADPEPPGEIESSLEYQDWQRDVIAPALAAMGPARLATPLAGPAPGRRGPRVSFLAMAASLLFVAGLAGWAGLQSRQIGRLAMEKQAAEAALKSERARREQATGLEDRGRQSLAETTRQSAYRVAELERRLAAAEAAAKAERAPSEKPALPQVLVNVPIAILNPAEVLRGEEDSDVTHLKPRPPYMAVVLNIDPEPEYPTYRAVLKREGNPAPLWQSDELESTDQRLHLLLDSSLLPPGVYRFDLYGLRQGRAEALGRYDLAIDR